MDIDELEHNIKKACRGSHIEVYGVIATDTGIEIDLFDYLNDNEIFEYCVDSLYKSVLNNLDNGMSCKIQYTSKTDISDIDGTEQPNYHCIMTIDVQ